MIKETFTRKHHRKASTSNQWHVVHARWMGDDGEPPFAQSIVSEHASRAEAEQAAEALRMALGPSMAGRTPDERDGVMVRKPKFRSTLRRPRLG